MRCRIRTALWVVAVLSFLTYVLEPLAETAAGAVAGALPAGTGTSAVVSRGGVGGADRLAVERAFGPVAAGERGAEAVGER